MKVLALLWLFPRNILIAPIVGWRKLISPLYGNVCRYYPSCSSYGLTAVQRFGILRGVLMTAWRILRCNPWSSGGVDEVPAGPDWIRVGRLGFVSPDFSEKTR
ncbi:MAG: membrane protein insertion efficiency factor YidD [Aquiluna sp.]